MKLHKLTVEVWETDTIPNLRIECPYTAEDDGPCWYEADESNNTTKRTSCNVMEWMEASGNEAFWLLHPMIFKTEVQPVWDGNGWELVWRGED